MILEDGETTLLFDPSFTRPGLLSWLNLTKLVPDPEVIAKNVSLLDLKKVDGIFVSHGHFDHAIDAPYLAHQFGTEVYGGDSLERMTNANMKRSQWSVSPFHAVKDRDVITLGKFKIQFFRRTHAALFPSINFHFLAGLVPPDFDFGFDQYREGEVWCYVIEHPDGKIFVDQGSHFFAPVKPFLEGVKTVFAGVANKESVDALVKGYVGELSPQTFIPLHFDFFFMSPNREKTRYLPNVQLGEIREKISKEHPTTRFIEPKWGEPIILSPPQP